MHQQIGGGNEESKCAEAHDYTISTRFSSPGSMSSAAGVWSLVSC